jgi:putative ATP-dependent endonuclease of the OLD family
MKLTNIKVRNFRSLRNVTINFQNFSVLIGENDAGKSSLLDLLEMALGNRKPDDNDFFSWEEIRGKDNVVTHHSEFIIVIMTFKLEASDSRAKEYAINDVVRVAKIWEPTISSTFYQGLQVINPALAQDFSKLKKAELETIVQSVDLAALPGLKTNEDKITWLVEQAKSFPKKKKWISVSGRLDFLPRFERYRAMDYLDPKTIVMKTLRQVYEQVIYQDAVDTEGNKTRHLDKRLVEVKSEAEKQIREKVQELFSYISCYAPRVKEVSFDPQIDFAGGLKDGEFQINDGRGFHYLSKVGDGTKRRIFISTIDWDRSVSVKQAESGEDLPDIIRGYDEPDSNLHYEAQRVMYRALADIAEAQNGHIQIFLCTHSLTMIDRAPAKNISLLRLRGNCTVVETLKTDEDPAVEAFLSDMAQELDISNTIIFYERCFLLVEGDTEYNALPLLYRTIYKRSMLEDGIRVISVKGNGSTKEFLRLLGINRQKFTFALLDSDTKIDDKGRQAKLTEEAFKECGFSEEFIRDRLFYVGVREFEDSFSDEVILGVLNKKYPKKEGGWSTEEVSALRRDDKKFSDELKGMIYSKCTDSVKRVSKPEFGKNLGEECKSDEHIPEVIKKLFESARTVAGN